MIAMILSNKAQCKLCKDIIESKHRHDFKWCKCGQMYIDGGKEYLRRGAKDLDNIIELSVTTDTFDA
jgi:tRNA(Ile2) C34 agmatinyltransferase TiaS